MSQWACLTFRDHFNTLERQVVDQLPSPKRFAMPSLVSPGATPSYVWREVENEQLLWPGLVRNVSISISTVLIQCRVSLDGFWTSPEEAVTCSVKPNEVVWDRLTILSASYLTVPARLSQSSTKTEMASSARTISGTCWPPWVNWTWRMRSWRPWWRRPAAPSTSPSSWPCSARSWRVCSRDFTRLGSPHFCSHFVPLIQE